MSGPVPRGEMAGRGLRDYPAAIAVAHQDDVLPRESLDRAPIAEQTLSASVPKSPSGSSDKPCPGRSMAHDDTPIPSKAA